MTALFNAWAVGIVCSIVASYLGRRLERKRCVNLLRRRVAYVDSGSKFSLLQAIKEINNG